MKSPAFTKRNVADSIGSAGPAAPVTWPTGQNSLACETPVSFRETRYGWLVMTAVWTISVAYLALYLRTGWFPYDAGYLAETAERVLHGQVPHRDFEAVYTGGLAYFDALAFRVFGTNFFSLRIPMFLCFLGWVPAVYRIGRRFVSPFVAGTVTLLAVAWSVPNYPEGTAAAYNLFLATWGVLALLRYTETEKRRWIWLAGFCAGLSFLVKIVGLYFIAGCLLFFVFREAALSAQNPSKSGRTGLIYQIFATTGMLVFLFSLIDLVSQRPALTEYFHFVVPSACLAGFILWETWHRSASGVAAGTRFRRLFSMVLTFAGGTAAPVALFLLWFAHERALTAWFEGTFVRATMHLQWEAYNAISPLVLVALAPLAVIFFLAWVADPLARKLVRYAGPVALAALLLAAWKRFALYSLVSYSLPLVVPLLAVATPLCLRRSGGLSGTKRQQVFLVVAVTVTWGLLWFPSATILYLCFVAPLMILALAALSSTRKPTEPAALGMLLIFFLVFAVWPHVPSFYQQRMVPWGQSLNMETLALPRAGGIRVPANVALEYQELIHLVRQHAHGEYIFATPDCPEVYFLSGLRNPTATSFDYLDPDFLNPTGRVDLILRALKDHEVNVVVLAPATFASLSGPVRPGLRAALYARFPHSAFVDNFEVRWKK